MWDLASRNAIFLTAVTSNDDHGGKNWRSEPNPGYTSPYTTSASVAGVQAALAAGRAFMGVLGRFDGELDIALGSVPVGSVTVGAPPASELTVYADRLPAGSQVQVLQGPVDYAGANGGKSGTSVARTMPAGAFVGGPVAVPLAQLSDTYTRAQVIGADGRTAALSQPIWCLSKEPPDRVPANRRYSAA